MAAAESPAVARRRVRLALREAREHLGLTQSQVAEAMEWSLSKVIRIENGEVTIAPNDLRPLMAYLGITDRAQTEALISDAKTSRSRQQWWDQPQFREALTPASRQLLQYEAEATVLRHYCRDVFPGPLQTRAYANAVLHKYSGELSEHEIAVRLEARMRRRANLLTRDDPPDLSVMLDEATLRRETGGRAVLREQLEDLLKQRRTGRFRVKVIPFTLDAPIPSVGSYEVLHLGDGQDDGILYRESHTYDEIVDGGPNARRHSDIFDHAWAAAADEESSLELLRERIEELSKPAAS